MDKKYNSVSQEVIQELRLLLGDSTISVAPHELEGFSSDEAPVARHFAAQVIVKTTSTDMISKLLRFANEKKIPVTPRGAGTGVSGGCVPVKGGIVLSLEKMNRILEVDADNFVAVVESGVTLSQLHQEVNQHGLDYPLYPGELSATIGGNVSTNAGGMNAVKYGVTRHHVLGLEAVLPNGDIITTGGKFVKCSTGYDLTQLIIGSEGTLGVVTRIILKLTPMPGERAVLFVAFRDLQNAIDCVPEILGLKVIPVGIEFMERDIIEIVEKQFNIEFPYHECDAFLLIIMEGESGNEINNYFEKVEAICRNHGAVEALLPSSERARRRLLEAREKFYSAIKKFAPLEIVDVVVPRSEIARFIKRVKEISRKYGIPVITYGHAGDGNVHLHPMCVNMDLSEWHRRLPDIMKEIYREGISFGGAISGEHGIGFDKKAYLFLQFDDQMMRIMKSIKLGFDPNNILNMGKIFDM